MPRLLKGAAWGAAAWLIYGVTELILSSGIQLWRFPEMEILGWQWRLIAMLMAAYAAIGLALGAIAGLVAPAMPQRLASLTLALAFLVNLISARPLARSEYIAVAVALFLLAALPQKRFQFLASPWTVSLLLLAAPWISREALDSRPSAVLKTGLSLLLIAFVAGLGWIWSRVRNGRAPALGSQAAAAMLAAGIFAGAVEIAKRPGPVRVDTPALAPGVKKPNVLLITMDTVRADHTSLYGYERDTTPNLRKFAQSATLYTRAIATSDFTLPTHASLFTGLYPNWSGALAPPNADARHVANPLRSDKTTLAEILRGQGYWTAESAANFGFLAPWTGLTRGFAASDLRRPLDLSTSNRPFYLRALARRLLTLVANMGRLDRTSVSAFDINRRVLEFLDAAKASGAPFFLFVNYMDAHLPYVPDPPFDRRYPGLDRRFIPAGVSALNKQVNAGARRLTAAETEHIVSQYDGGVAEEDAAIGDLLARLRESGLYDGALIVITADHGNAHGEHGLLDHFLGFVYQELVHVPLAIKYPGQRAAARSDDLVSQVDILPTILDSLQLKPGPEVQGRSLLKPAPESGAIVFSQGTRNVLTGAGNPRFGGLRRAIFSGSMKLILWTAGPPEMYDLAADPAERRNLYNPDDPQAIKLRRGLETWIAAMPRLIAPHNLDRISGERLKSLGYIQ
ncbi:MAG TPA: sulfatase [Bryobacteraceae bacterium]|nr:sulfatase [Bryobacteraceae bacterium]